MWGTIILRRQDWQTRRDFPAPVSMFLEGSDKWPIVSLRTEVTGSCHTDSQNIKQGHKSLHSTCTVVYTTDYTLVTSKAASTICWPVLNLNTTLNYNSNSFVKVLYCMSSWLHCIVGDIESLKGLSHRLIIGQMFVETFVLNNCPVYTALQA